MTKINISHSHITIEGHSLDIVCASISTMSDFLECHDDLIREEDKDGYYKLTGIKDSTALRVFKDLIGQLANQYPREVEVTYDS